MNTSKVMTLDTDEEWDGLVLTPEELVPMKAGYDPDGFYDLFNLTRPLEYSCSAIALLLRRSWSEWNYDNYDRDGAIALVRFILASRKAVKAREALRRQVRAHELRKELTGLAATDE